MNSRRGIEVLRHRGLVRRVGVRERVAPRLDLLLSLGAGWPRQPRKIGEPPSLRIDTNNDILLAMKTQIIEILKEIRPEFEFDGVENFFDEGMLDSFDLMTLVSTLDERFGIKIDGTDILPENFANVDAIEALVQRSRKR